MNDSSTDALTWDRLLRPLRGHYIVIVAVALVAAAATSAFTLLRPRDYAADLALSTISAPRTAALGQGLSAALMGNMASGMQPSPAFVNRLVTSQVVLAAVALNPAGDGNTTPLARRLRPSLAADAPDYRLVRVISKAVSVSLDRETGIVAIRVSHRDSALARQTLRRLVDEVANAFRTASQTQARQLREAQEARVDSLAHQLTRAREALARFIGANRVVAPYSQASVARDRLEADVTLSQTVYGQATMDREAALGKELEQTPAVVVVDPIPRQLVPISPRAAEKSILAAILGLMVCAGWFILRERPAVSVKPAQPDLSLSTRGGRAGG